MIRTHFFLFIALASPLWAGEGYHGRYRMITPQGHHAFDILVVVPERFGFIGTLRSAGDSEAEFAESMAENRRQSRLFVSQAFDFAIEVYRQWGLVNSVSEAAVRDELGKITSMEWPLVAVVPPFSDGPILHMVALAPSDGSHLPVPSLSRVYRPGFSGPQLAVPQEELRVVSGWDSAVPYYHPLEVGGGIDEATSLLLSLLPRVVGRFTEAKLFISNPAFSLKLSKVVHQLVLTLGLHRYSPDPVPDSLRAELLKAVADPIVGGAVDDFLARAEGTRWQGRARALARHWRTVLPLMPMQNSFVLGETTQAARIRLYRSIYGTQAREEFSDADYGGEPTALFQMDLPYFETVPVQNLARLPGYSDYDGSRLLASITGLGNTANCAVIMSAAAKWVWLSDNPERVSSSGELVAWPWTGSAP